MTNVIEGVSGGCFWREAVKEVGLWEYQDLFDHQTYAMINHFKLSTSSVPVGLTSSFMGNTLFYNEQ